MNKARLIIGLVVAVVSFSYLFGYAIPHMQEAMEIQKQAQLEYDIAQAELNESMEELNTSVDEVLDEESIQ